MKVNLVWTTPDAEKHVAFCARVSNPKNQDNPDYSKLIAYCIKNNHHSILEMASMCVEIETSRAISAQIIRHRSFSFQEFSQRYAEATEFKTYKARRQDTKNRQNSVDDMSRDDVAWFRQAQEVIQDLSSNLYNRALDLGIAKEQARMLLPMSTATKLYMSGTLRSFTHFIDVRTDPSTQLEHREIAEAIKKIFVEQFPTISKAKRWSI